MSYNQSCWHVFLGPNKIETVFYDSDMSIDQVKRALISEGFDSRIELIEEY